MAELNEVQTAAVEKKLTDLKSANPKPANPRKQPLQINRFSRLAIQIIFLILAPQAFSMAFSGIRYIFVCFGAGDPVELTRFIALSLILIVATIVVGRFFCGYLCAFGALGDILYQLGDAICKLLHIKRKPLPDKLENILRKIKYVVLVAILIACAAGVSSVISAGSPWTAFGRLMNLQVLQMGVLGTILLALIAVGMIWKERFFCEFLCPLGAIFSLLPIMPWANHRKDPKVCNGCQTCKRNCPVNIMPPDEGELSGECIACGRCKHVCPQHCVTGSLEPIANQTAPNATKELIRVIVTAVVFFGLFWLMCAVQFLPTIDLFG